MELARLVKGIYELVNIITSLLKGGYLPRPGVAFAAAETMSTKTRCTWFVTNKKIGLTRKARKIQLQEDPCASWSSENCSKNGAQSIAEGIKCY